MLDVVARDRNFRRRSLSSTLWARALLVVCAVCLMDLLLAKVTDRMTALRVHHSSAVADVSVWVPTNRALAECLNWRMPILAGAFRTASENVEFTNTGFHAAAGF